MRKGTLRLTSGLYTHTNIHEGKEDRNGEREEEKEGGREGGKGLKTISQGDQSERRIHREGSLYSDQPLRSGIRRGTWPDRLGKTESITQASNKEARYAGQGSVWDPQCRTALKDWLWTEVSHRRCTG